MSQTNKIIIAIAALAVLVGAGVVFSRADRNTGPVTELVEDGVVLNETAQAVAAAANSGKGALDTPNPLGEIVLGNPDAPVTIVEYASLTCSHCGQFHRETLPKVKADYIDKGLVKIYFRPFPFDPYATAGAMLAQCVAPKARVHFLDILFKRQNAWLQSENVMEELQKLARQAGLSEADFVVCLKDADKLEGIRVMQSAAAEELGVRSTPTFFINGEKVEGNQPYAEIEKTIKRALP
ncbi:MAG: DsbA family protein [Rhodobiaceae bacterium]|nr:DsbA family protein [Rhodobiaceae bacterium]